MSASDKKKLRKEQNAAAVTERQQAEKKNQKKTKAYTITFIVAMVLVVAIFLGTVLSTPVRNTLSRITTAATVNDHTIKGVEFNYFYVDTVQAFVNNLYSTWGSYTSQIFGLYGLDATASLGSQSYNTDGDTWADYFATSAVESAKWVYGMYDKAMSENFVLGEEDQAYLESVETSINAIVEAFPSYYSSANAYIQAIYGNLASMETYMDYLEIQSIAYAYAAEYADSLEYTDADFRAYEADKYEQYCSYSYATYTVYVKDYYEGGTTEVDDDGNANITYSDEEKAAAVAAALEDVESLVSGTYSSVADLNLAINRLGLEDEDEETLNACTEITAKLYTSLSTSDDIKEWVTSSDRVNGDIKYFETTTTTDDVTTTTSFSIVLFIERIDNTMSIGTVRHLLVAFENEDGQYSSTNTEFTDEEKAAALERAEELLAEYKAGEMTEEAFTELLNKYSDDRDEDAETANNEGLYSDITPDSSYVESFRTWACADHEVGDVEIIESIYGYHIMYYVGADDLNYRDSLINADMIDEAYDAWEEEILAATDAVTGNLNFVNGDFIIPTSWYSSST